MDSIMRYYVKRKNKNIFSDWKKKYKYFSPDGIVDFYSYNNATLNIAFILKETNKKAGQRRRKIWKQKTD